ATGITMDVHMAKVMQKVVEVHALSGGQFDPTVAPLVKLWGFDDMKLNLNVSRTDITAALVNVGMKFLKVQGNELVKLKPAVTIDLNGIAQGYSVDLMADLLTQRGITSFLVELGGEIAVGGPKPDGRPYTVAIERPIKPGAEATTRILQLKKGAVTTSGNYRRFLTGKNGTIGHLINPKTGYSFDNGMISVTVIAPDALTADAYDNAFMGMGVKETLKLVEKMKGVEVYMIYRDGKGVVREAMSPTFRQFLERLD
ncbi:MAG: FAD:protein FMN transferase, partial [Sphingobacteriales bacterium]